MKLKRCMYPQADEERTRTADPYGRSSAAEHGTREVLASW